MITFVEKGDSGRVYFKYNKAKVSDEAAQNVTRKAVGLLKEFN